MALTIPAAGLSKKLLVPDPMMASKNLIPLIRLTVALGVIGMFLVGLLLQAEAQTATSVTLAWDHSSSSGIAGYRLYYGTSSGTYPNILDVGNATIATIPNLAAGQTYYFVVTDYDTAGLESAPSNQVSLAVPPAAITLWQNQQTGGLYMWSVQNGALTGQFLGNVPLVWKLVGIGNFSGAGYGDILWENTQSYDLVVWVMHGAAIAETYVLPYGLPVVAVRSFSNSGRSDILLRDLTNGQLYMLINQGGGSFVEQPVGPAVSVGWAVVGAADVYGDGGSELFWSNSASGQIVVWRLNGATVVSGQLIGSLPAAWQIAGFGDFNGDGNDDILLRNNQSGEIVAWIMSGLSITSVWLPGAPPLQWQIAGIVNLSGTNQRDVLLMYQPSGQLFLWSGGRGYFNQTPIGSIDPAWMVVPN
jgi:hypothetical protein